MSGAILILLGVLAGLAGWLILRSLGSSWRVGRLLAAAPLCSLAEAAEVARAGESAYLRVHGRIDSDEEFPGDDGKPLVFRRRRLQHRRGRSSWVTFDDERLAVPFRLVDRGERLEIDVDALGDGLVVVPREAEGVAADVRAEAVSGSPPQLPPDEPVRLRVEQVSSVDHATAAGVPRLGPGGSVVLGAGLGRPLVLTTLDPDESMRVLAGGRRRLVLAAGAALLAAAVLIGLGLVLLLTTAALGADASNDPGLAAGTTSGLLEGGDPRSEGAGPGIVGAPLLILLGVVVLGLATVILTVVLARLTRRG